MDTTLIRDEEQVRSSLAREEEHIRNKIRDDLTPAINIIDGIVELLERLNAGNFGSTMTRVLRGIHSLIGHAQNMEGFLKDTNLESNPKLTKTTLKTLMNTLEKKEIKALIKNNKALAEREMWVHVNRGELRRNIAGQKKFFIDTRKKLQQRMSYIDEEKHEHSLS